MLLALLELLLLEEDTGGLIAGYVRESADMDAEEYDVLADVAGDMSWPEATGTNTRIPLTKAIVSE